MTTNTFTFCRESRKKLQGGDHYVKTLRLTNSVLHVNTSSDVCANSRDTLLSRNFNKKGPVEILNTLSNDSQSGPNYRIDLECGRFLSFMQAGNHIRAGKASPMDAVASVYKFHALVLNHSGSADIYYPDQLLVSVLVCVDCLCSTTAAVLTNVCLCAAGCFVL